MFAVLLILNFGISCYNAHSVGKVWSESKQIGGMLRVNVIVGYIMAILGFTMVYGCILLMILPSILQMFTDVNSNDLYDVTSLTSDLLYLLIGFCVIPTGFVIWFNSMLSCGRRRSFGRGVTFGWNSYAQIHNTISFMRNAPGAFGRVKEHFFGKTGHSGGSFGRKDKGSSGGSFDRKGKGSSKKNNEVVAVLAAMIVLLAVCGGWFTASAIMKRADSKYDSLEWLGFAKPEKSMI